MRSAIYNSSQLKKLQQEHKSSQEAKMPRNMLAKKRRTVQGKPKNQASPKREYLAKRWGVTGPSRLHPALDVAADGLSGLGGDASSSASSGHNSFQTKVHVGGGSGHSSGYGGGPMIIKYEEEKECDDGLNPVLAGAVLAGLAAASYIIFNYLTVNGRRKRRDISMGEEDPKDWTNYLYNVIWAGM